MGQPVNWSHVEAPSLDDIEILAREAFRSLPESFRALCGDVPFVVQDFPEDDVMLELDLETPFDILGLFQGVDLAARDAASAEPTLIFLYRRPVLDYWAEFHGTLGDVVRHVVVHEIGHHFGLSDEDMEKIEHGA